VTLNLGNGGIGILVCLSVSEKKGKNNIEIKQTRFGFVLFQHNLFLKKIWA